MNIAFIGHGNVGGPLADRLQRAGHHVTLAVRDPAAPSVAAVRARNGDLAVAAPDAALLDAEVVVLATPFGVAADVVGGLRDTLASKVLIDCTNPIGPGLTHGLGNTQSGTQMIQAVVPDTRVVKAFTIYGSENLEDPSYPGYDVLPMMPLCGDDPDAKAVAADLVRQCGWEPLDVGGAEQALHLEHMTLLWVRMVRIGGHAPGLVWAKLQR